MPTKLFEKGQIPWNKGKKWDSQSGDKHPMWKGGETATKDGYIKILVKAHPMSDCYGYVLRSHVVMEKIIGRFLEPGEVVHHLNHIRTDDRPENLRLIISRSEHTKLHGRNKGVKYWGINQRLIKEL